MRLSRRELLTAVSVAAVMAALPVAFAQDHAAAGAAPDEAEVARSIELGGLVFPIFDANMKLKNYLFISARMLAGPDKDVWKYREQQHFIRDAIIRASHKVSFNVAGNYKKLDEKLAAAECLKAANAVLGDKDALITMTFTQIASQLTAT
ncbi:MAG: hypothetical protein Q8R82_06300 [Hyphomonadaceae bacterium]|nr:hypothetical protein [Hyphomonadaceae bacterium]